MGAINTFFLESLYSIVLMPGRFLLSSQGLYWRQSQWNLLLCLVLQQLKMITRTTNTIKIKADPLTIPRIEINISIEVQIVNRGDQLVLQQLKIITTTNNKIKINKGLLTIPSTQNNISIEVQIVNRVERVTHREKKTEKTKMLLVNIKKITYHFLILFCIVIIISFTAI